MKAFVPGCAAAVLLALTAFAQDGSVAGAWLLEMSWSGARSTGSCDFTIDAGRLSGTCGGDDRFAVNGRVDGRKLSWQVDVKQGGAEGHMEFEGELDDAGTAIKGTCTVGDQAGTFTMKRRAA